MSQQKNSINYVTRTCKICNKNFSRYRTSIICSDECRKINSTNNKELSRKKSIEDSHIKYPSDCDVNSFIECKICGYRSPDIGSHILIHSIKSEEYKKEHGEVVCVNKKILFVGEKNPAYNHGGKYSPFSKKFIHYKSDEYIENLIRDSAKTKIKNNSNPLIVGYYTARGMSLEEAEAKLSDRQRTFSLEKCIEKHGVEQGSKFWQDRQDKWQQTLNSKSQLEIDDINKRKTSKINYKTLWGLNLDENGWVYVIKIDDTKLKIGITSKPNINKRYKQSDLNCVEVLLFEKAEDINHAFMIEQYVKRNNLNKIFKGEYGAFGWTEVIHEPDVSNIISSVTELLKDKQIAYDKFKNETF